MNANRATAYRLGNSGTDRQDAYIWKPIVYVCFFFFAQKSTSRRRKPACYTAGRMEAFFTTYRSLFCSTTLLHGSSVHGCRCTKNKEYTRIVNFQT